MQKRIHNFENINALAIKKGRQCIVVAGAHNEEVIKAVYKAFRTGLCTPILVGQKKRIFQIAQELELDLSSWSIHHGDNDADIARISIECINSFQGDILMKGEISTPVLLKEVLKPQYQLRQNTLLSHIALLDIPDYEKLLMITDSGMNIRPGLEEKVKILKNAIRVLNMMGQKAPGVSILSANEKVSEKLPETIDAAELVKMGREGVFGKAIVEGPYALDVAFSSYAARIKKINSQLKGTPDLLLMPDVTSGNILAKGLVYLAKAQICGIVVGAKVPIVLISRAEYADTWINSIALASLAES